MTQSNDMDTMLDGVFADAQRLDMAQMPSAALLARVMADAEAELAARSVPVPETSRKRRGLLAGFVEMIGGPRALGGLVTAGITGLWIGAFGGAQVASYLGVSTGSVEVLEAVDLMPVEDVFAMVGGIGG